jgi:hypothetical protein
LRKIRKHFEEIRGFISTEIECGTGEVTLHPQLRDLLNICTDFGGAYFPTNLSLGPECWLPEKNIHRISVVAALHPQNEERIDSFVKNLNLIRDKGGNVQVSFVCHPKRMHKKELWAEFFRKRGITFRYTPFSGSFKDKIFPEAYSEKEKAELGLQRKDWIAQLPMIIPYRNFYGIPCLAGFLRWDLTADGVIRRCLYDNQPLESVYEKPMPCRVKNCGCGFHLEKLNKHDAFYWNHHRKMAGFPKIEGPEEQPDFNKTLEFKLQIFKALLSDIISIPFEKGNRRYVF